MTCALCRGDPRVREAQPHAVAIFPTGSKSMQLIVTYPLCRACCELVSETVRAAVVGAVEGQP